jgi:hypothetical protein
LLCYYVVLCVDSSGEKTIESILEENVEKVKGSEYFPKAL